MKTNFCKLLLSTLCVIICLSMCTFAAETPSVATDEIIGTVKILEIANGDENGNMNYDKTVTRAEFIKMAVSASVNKEKAQTTTVSFSIFPDVKHDFWGAGYISTAISNGLVNGYLDGTFRPNNDVTLEEAATIALRLLGYTDSDFKGSYPSSQLEKYHELKLDENMSAQKGKKLTREECMILLYNTLCTKTKSGAVYCTTLGYSVNGKNKIDYAALIEEKLEGPYTVNENGDFSKAIGFTPDSLTDYHLNNAPAKKDDIMANDVIYYSDKINAVYAFRKTATGIISSYGADEMVSLYGSKSYKVETSKAKSKLSIGGRYNEEKSFVTLILGLNDVVIDVIDGSTDKISENTDNASYISMIDATISLPIYIKNDGDIALLQSKIPFNMSSAHVYIDGAKVSSYSPALSDVLYYSKPFGSIWVYRKTKSGTIDNISSANLTVGNDVYTIATDEAKLKVSTYGEYKTDSYVTLILGKNDEVIDIIGNTSKDGVSDAAIESTISLPLYIRNEETASTWAQSIPFELSDATFYLEGKQTDDISIEVSDVIYYSTPYKSIWVFRSKVNGILSNVSSSSVNLGSKTYALATTEAKNKVSNYGPYGNDDYVTLVLGKGDEVIDITDADIEDIGNNDDDSSYSEVVSGSLKGPYIVTSDGKTDKLTFDIEQATIFHLNAKIDKDDIKPYDVYYFSPVLNTIWIYRDTVSGTIEQITPLSSPTTVVMSGTTYSIESSQASYDLSSFGGFGVGDKATFLLGMDGKVASVVSVDTVSRVYYGIVTARGSKEFTEKDGDKYTADFVTVTDLSCNSYTYEHDNRTLGVGDIVRVSVGETIKLSEQSTTFGRSTLAAIINALNDNRFSENCSIVEFYDGKIKKLYPSRFKGLKLSLDSFLYSSTVLYCEFDENNCISQIIFNNFTGDLCDYGVATSVSSSQIKYMTDNTVKTFSGNGASCDEGAVAILTDAGSVNTLSSLRSYVEDFDFITAEAVFDEDDKVYPLSEDVKVFHYNAGTYKYISLDEALKGKFNYYAFYDKLPEYGGRIRVIIVINA